MLVSCGNIMLVLMLMNVMFFIIEILLVNGLGVGWVYRILFVFVFNVIIFFGFRVLMFLFDLLKSILFVCDI